MYSAQSAENSLSSRDPTSRSPQVVLGRENRETVLLAAPGGNTLASADTFEVLACDEFRVYWLRWENQTYQVQWGRVMRSRCRLRVGSSSGAWSMSSASFGRILPPGCRLGGVEYLTPSLSPLC